MGAYEALWLRADASFKTLGELFRASPGALPSELVDPDLAEATGAEVRKRLAAAGVRRFGVRVHGAGDYPARLRDAASPVELLYFQGLWELVETPSVAIVGTRRPSPAGIEQADALARDLVGHGFTIVSGLAAGIDTAAHRAALAAGGRTIAVIGTPLSETYPAQNQPLQAALARDHLVISQVPVLRYDRQTWRENRLFFPARNVTMSALTSATVIVEAGEGSGTLTQARAALRQGRRLFILDACFDRAGLTWPAEFARRGAIRVAGFAQIRDALAAAPH